MAAARKAVPGETPEPTPASMGVPALSEGRFMAAASFPYAGMFLSFGQGQKFTADRPLRVFINTNGLPVLWDDEE